MKPVRNCLHFNSKPQRAAREPKLPGRCCHRNIRHGSGCCHLADSQCPQAILLSLPGRHRHGESACRDAPLVSGIIWAIRTLQPCRSRSTPVQWPGFHLAAPQRGSCCSEASSGQNTPWEPPHRLHGQVNAAAHGTLLYKLRRAAGKLLRHTKR